MQLNSEDLLISASITFDLVIPPIILNPGISESSINEIKNDFIVQIRPLNLGTFQLIMKAAKHDVALIPLLMIKESLVEPEMSLKQVKKLPLGLVKFLIEHIREISGLNVKKSMSM